MAFCANCGTETPGAFCPNCGAPVAGPASGTGPSASPPPPPGYTPPIGSPSAPGLSQNVASALCYVFGLVTGIIFLVLAPYNQDKTIRFHAFQSIFGHIGIIICWIALRIVSSMMHGFGIFGLGLLYPLLWLSGFLLWLYMMWSAYNNKMVVLPVVGELAQKQA